MQVGSYGGGSTCDVSVDATMYISSEGPEVGLVL